MKRKLFAAGLCLFVSWVSGCNPSSELSKAPASPTPRPMEAATPAPTPTPTPETGEMKSLPNGMKYQDIVVGRGMRPLFGQKVRLHYVGRLDNGVKFDSSEGKRPFEMVLGKDKVIKGWELGVGGGQGLEAMRVGGKRKLIIPPDLGYGNLGAGTIPPNATLTFEIELVGVK